MLKRREDQETEHSSADHLSSGVATIRASARFLVKLRDAIWEMGLLSLYLYDIQFRVIWIQLSYTGVLTK